MNRTLPRVSQPAAVPTFSATPTDTEIFRARVFGEPLVPIGGATSGGENSALGRALEDYLALGAGENVQPLTKFLDSYPDTAWRVSLLANLAVLLRRTAYFSRALAISREAWALSREDESRHGRAMADKALGTLLGLLSRLGRMDELEELLEEIESRSVTGSATEAVTQAKQALWLMTNKPEESFLCGPLALDRLLAYGNSGYELPRALQEARSTTSGTSLKEVEALSRQVGLNMQAAFRDAGAEPILPAVIHWKAGHYAAVVAERDGRYLVQDTTFGEEAWISRSALEDEASGYFLVPMQASWPTGWRPVESAEADSIWGRGVPAGQDPEPTTPSSNQDPPCQRSGSGPTGLATYSFHTMLASLRITDTPVGYRPPIGPPVLFTVNYIEREAFQPQIFTYSNLGPKWTSEWITYITDDPGSAGASPTLFVAGGGQETYTGFNSNTNQYAPHYDSRAILERVTADPIRYERYHPDGAKEVYAQPDGALTAPRKVFLTEKHDAQGNALSFTYDASIRLVAIQDAIGQVTTLSYGLAGDPLKITAVTDPFGRSATLDYDAQGRLLRITDVIDLTSEFTYAGNEFVDSLTTPYGTTRFVSGGTGGSKFIEAIDPLGGHERVEYRHQHTTTVNNTDPAELIPTGFTSIPLNSALSFYWDKLAMARGGRSDQAEITSWLWRNNLAADVAATRKKPLENRVWYKYPGQGNARFVGTHASPSRIGRVLDDGSSQINQYEYNSKGKRTKAIDPTGRQRTYCYDGNEIDLLQIRQTTGRPATDPDPCTGDPGTAGINELLASYTYNSQHEVLTSTDAAGQTWTHTYTPTGQLETEVSPERDGPDGNPLSAAERTTTYEYYPTGVPGEGRLKKATGPSSPQGSPTSDYSYDAFGRLETTTDTDGYMITRESDDLDRLTKMSFPDGTYTETSYERLDAVRHRDRLGRWSHMFHDALRRPVGLRSPLGRTVTYQWCNCGSLESLVDSEGNETAWERDIQGRVTSETRANGAIKVYEYETTTSRLKEIKDAQNQVKEYEYYPDNRLKRIAYKNSLGQPDPDTPEVALVYDPDYGHLESRTDGGSSTTLYDHHPVTSPPTLGALRLASVDGPLPNDTITYEYDEVGRVAGRTIDGVAATQAYDALGRIEEATNALGTFNYTYEGATRRVSSVLYPNDQTTAVSYLGNLGDHRLSEIHYHLPGGATLLKHGYTSDAGGRIKTWSQTLESNPAALYEFGYDAADQLVSATLRTTVPDAVSKSYSYRYDKVGNRTVESIDEVVTTASHDEMNRLFLQQVGGTMRFAGSLDEPATVTVGGSPARVAADNSFEGTVSVVAGTNAVEVVAQDYASPGPNTRTNTYGVEVTGSSGTLGYDASGNLESHGVRSFEWDVENRLLAVTQGTLRSEFGYDGLGRRVSIVEKDGTAVLSSRRLLWCDDITLCEERDATGATVLKRFFVHGETQGADSYFYARDHLGSVGVMTDATAAVRAVYEYDPYGRRAKISGDRDATFGFTGHLEHGPTALTLAPFRAYDSDLGRWVSEDPLGLHGGALNLYGYAANRPITVVDPSGLCIGGCVLEAAVLAAAAAGVVLTTVYIAKEIADKIAEGIEEIIEPDEDAEVPDAEPPEPRTGDGTQEPVKPEREPIKVPPFDPESLYPPDEKCEGEEANEDPVEDPEEKERTRRTCKKLLIICQENPTPVNPLFGPKKPCLDCFIACKNNDGEWPFDKCPLF